MSVASPRRQVFVLVLIGLPIVEVLVFIEIARAIGWLLAIVLLLATSTLGARLLRAQGRLAIKRISLAVSERRGPAQVAIESTLGFLGGVLLVAPGFVTDAVGALLLLPPTRKLTGRWLSHHYAGRTMSFVAAAGRFASGDRSVRPPDVESTVVEDDLNQLGR
jgi:UPF0716 protein FxsA